VIKKIIISIPGGLTNKDLDDLLKFLKNAFSHVKEGKEVLRIEFYPRRGDR